MSSARASGGGDRAEDVAGGMELLNTKIDTEDRSQTLLVVHILDAIAHGHGDDGDNHNTEAQRTRLQNAIGRMTELGMTFSDFEYHFFGVEKLPVFKQHVKATIEENLGGAKSIDNVFKEMDLQRDFQGALMHSTFSSISGSVKHNFLDPFAMECSKKITAIDDFAKFGLEFANSMSNSHICEKYPTHDNIAILNCRITKAKMQDTGNAFRKSLVEYCKPAATLDVFNGNRMNWWSQFQRPEAVKRAKLTTDTCFIDNPLLFVSCDAFGRGKEHVVFHGKMASLPSPNDAKELKTVSRNDWKPVEAEFHPVMLKFNLASESAVQPKLEIYAAIKFLLNHFNAMNVNKSLGFIHMEIIAPFIMHLSSASSVMSKGRPVFVSPKADKSFDYELLGEYSLAEYPTQYDKWINNNGVFSAHMDPLLSPYYVEHYCVIHAFILYCWRITNGNFVPSDFQGKLVTRSDFEKIGQDKETAILLTDMACSAKNIEAFDASVNLGDRFVSKIARDAFDIFSKYMPARFNNLVSAIGVKASDFDDI